MRRNLPEQVEATARALVHAGHPCRGEQEAGDDDRGADPVRADETGVAGSFVESRESFHEKVAARKRRHEVPAPPKRNPVSLVRASEVVLGDRP